MTLRDNALNGLAPREKEIATMLLSGSSVAQVATELGIKETSVRSTMHRVYSKKNVGSFRELSDLCLQEEHASLHSACAAEDKGEATPAALTQLIIALSCLCYLCASVPSYSPVTGSFAIAQPLSLAAGFIFALLLSLVTRKSKAAHSLYTLSFLGSSALCAGTFACSLIGAQVHVFTSLPEPLRPSIATAAAAFLTLAAVNRIKRSQLDCPMSSLMVFTTCTVAFLLKLSSITIEMPCELILAMFLGLACAYAERNPPINPAHAADQGRARPPLITPSTIIIATSTVIFSLDLMGASRIIQLLIMSLIAISMPPKSKHGNQLVSAASSFAVAAILSTTSCAPGIMGLPCLILLASAWQVPQPTMSRTCLACLFACAACTTEWALASCGVPPIVIELSSGVCLLALCALCRITAPTAQPSSPTPDHKLLEARLIVDGLDERSVLIAQKTIQGQTAASIGRELGYSPATIRAVLTHVYRHYNVRTKQQLAEKLTSSAPCNHKQSKD